MATGRVTLNRETCGRSWLWSAL